MVMEPYSSVKKKRRLEIIVFLLSSLGILIGTVAYVVLKYMLSYNGHIDKSIWKCTYETDITNSTITDGNIIADGISYPPGSYWIAENRTIFGCPCLLKPCINKCCRRNQIMGVKKLGVDKGYDFKCFPDPKPFNPSHHNVHTLNGAQVEPVTVMENHYFVISDSEFKCSDNEILGVLDKERRKTVVLLDTGDLLWNGADKLKSYTEYCLDSTVASQHLLFYCIKPLNKEDSVVSWRGICMLISVPFMLVTLISYCLLPQLNDLHGKTLVCHVTSLCVAFLCFGLLHTYIPSDRHGLLCYFTGFLIQFSVLASFFWLNVMAIDIWWVFSGLKPKWGSNHDAEKDKFRMFSLYAWGSPLAIMVITLLLQFMPSVPRYIVKPDIGIKRCFLSDPDALRLYLYLPMGVLVYLNTVMLIMSFIRYQTHLKRVRTTTTENIQGEQRFVSNGGEDYHRYGLYLKFSMFMGLIWAFEVISFLVNPSSFWIIIETVISLQGIVIMCLFVCQPRILRMLAQRFPPQMHLINFESQPNPLSDEQILPEDTSSNEQC